MLMSSFYTCKCSGTQLLFQQQWPAKLYHNIQLDVLPKFYADGFTLCTNKISINLPTGAKAAHRTSTGFNFINILRPAFTPADPKSPNKTVKLSVFFRFRDQKLLVNWPRSQFHLLTKNYKAKLLAQKSCTEHFHA